MTITWPDGPDGTWRAVRVAPPPTGGRLSKVTVTVVPELAFRLFRVYRESDEEVLANGGWTPSRERPIRLLPATDWVGPTDTVRAEVCTWGAASCEGSLTWT